jgi:hypothetical protein
MAAVPAAAAGIGRGAAAGLAELAHIESSAAWYAAQGHFAKQVVQQAAHIGQQHDDHEPGQSHVGPHVPAQQDAQAEAGNQQYMKSQQQPGHESVQQRWTLSSITGSAQAQAASPDSYATSLNSLMGKRSCYQ